MKLSVTGQPPTWGFAATLLWLATFFCLLPPARAQYIFDSWTTENGLPHNSIRALLQTSDGYLWIATGGGLVRFDGIRFRVFNRSNTPQIRSNEFFYFALREDRQGGLWAGTINGGAIRYYNNTFTAYTTKEGLPNNTVSRIDVDAEGTVWIFTNPGLAKWQNGRLTRVAPEPGSPFNEHLIAPRNTLGVDGRLAGLWRVEGNQWHRFAYGKWSVVTMPPHVTDPHKLEIASIVEDFQGRLWFSEKKRWGEYYSFHDGRLATFRSGFAPGAFVCHKDRDGQLWVGHHNGDVALWKDGRLTPISGLSTAYTFRVLEDREGTIWIGTTDRGLFRARRQVITTHRHPGGPELNDVRPMLQDRMEHFWFGSHGLYRFSGNRFDSFRHFGSQSTYNWRNMVSALHEDRDGTLLVGTWEGAGRLSGGRLASDGAFSGVAGRIYDIHRDRRGDLWLGGERGLYRIRGGILTHYEIPQSHGSDYVKVILESRSGSLWIGTTAGLMRMENDVLSAFSEASELSSSNISSLYEDSAGVLWIGTNDAGLNRLEHGKLTRYTSEHGLYNDAVFQILEDDQGGFWISCHLGIYRVRKQELSDFAAGRISAITSTYFGKSDGMVSVECNSRGQPAGFKARDGKLWFPTTAGLVVIDPKAVRPNLIPPPVLISEVSLEGRPVAFKNGVTVAPRQPNLEIQYTALSLIKSGQMRFRYKMEGLDPDWTEAGTRRTSYYSRIPPGSYTFKLNAANSDGIWSTEGASLTVVVLPPFHATWWFRALVLLSIAGAAIFAWRRRALQWERAQAVQHAFSRQLIASQESERKRIAAELHDSLGQRLVIIKNLALLHLQALSNNGADREQVEEISSEASRAIAEVREISYDLRPYQLDRLGLTKAVQAVIRSAAAASQTAFSSDIDDIDDLFPPEYRINFYRIVQECLNNIVKHSDATEARISVKRNSIHLLMIVSDNGKGFTPGAVRAEPDAGGFGLMGISERVQLLAGKTEILSAPGRGTQITIDVDATALRHGH